MSADRQTMLLHAVPLLILAGLYGLVSILLGVSLLRERKASGLGLGIWLLFTVVAAISALLAGLALAGHDVLADEPSWLVVVSAVAVAVPAIIVLVRGHDRALLVTARRRVREAEEIATERGREADAISRLSSALSQAQTAEEAARSLFDEVQALLEPDALLLAQVDEELRTAVGLVARGVDESWWRGVTIALDSDSGAIVSVVRERVPMSVYDAVTSTSVNRPLADAVGAKSAAFVPLLSEGDVVGVLVVATRTSRRSFTAAELDVVQGLASEAAIALGRARSNEALRAALGRERLVAEIGRRVRSELDVDTALRVAVEETAKAMGVVTRSFIRLGEIGEPMPVLAEWNAPGVGPVGDVAPRLPGLNLAARDRRTVAVDDVETAPEFEDASLGGRETLLELGTRGVLATPIVVFDRVIGVFSLHRAEATRWLPGEIALAEAVARELGLAIHTARLLGENQQRLRRQETLIEAAQVLTSDLRFESVIRRLVEEVVALTGADAADCWVMEPDSNLLRCRAVLGVPEWNVGRQIPAEGTIGRALQTHRTVLTHDFAVSEDPPPSPPYAVFSDVLATPITWLGEARGVLGVCSREPGRFAEGDIEVVEAFARFASLALHNAESFEERERQTQVQRGFYRIAQVLGTTLSRAETLDALAQAACDALGGDAALVLELQGGAASLAGTHELPGPIRTALAERGPAGRLAGFAEQERILASTELATDERFDAALREPLVAEGYGSLLCAPVAGVRDQAYAVVVLFRGGRTFADEDVLLTQHLSGAARGALERSELFEGERRARTFSQRLAQVGALLATSLDPAVVLEEVSREAPGLLGADAAVIRLLERDELVVRAAAGTGTERLAGTSAGSTLGISGAVAQARTPVTLADAEQQQRLTRGDLLLEPGAAAACVAVPLVAHGGGLYGVLAVYSRVPRAWRDDEVQTLAALAAASSASVANAELYQRVAEEKERSGAILANIADGIVAVDRESRIVLWNAMAEQITGVPASEARGRLVAEVLQRELAADGEDGDQERHIAIRRGGDEVWLALSEAVMHDAAGSVAGRIFAFRDVSRERGVEQMRSDFVSTVSHELRTPLTSIYGFAETLKRADVDFSDAERETFLRYIASESERLIRIVDDLLDVARLEAGTLEVALEPTEVGRVAREAVAVASGRANGSRSFSIQVEPADLAVRADREKFAQVLDNLLDNAVRYSPEGGTISVVARGHRGAAEITVADDGVGIAEADRRRVFTKFFRAERASAAPGAGLGLFLVRGLVAAMGGRIWVESEEGLGSSFTFELPLADGDPASSPPLEAAAS